MTVRYAGRVYDSVSYESVIVVERPVTVAKLQEAVEKAKLELQLAHPSIRLEKEERILTGFGVEPPIMVVFAGNIWECPECSGTHPLERCPVKKSE